MFSTFEVSILVAENAASNSARCTYIAWFVDLNCGELLLCWSLFNIVLYFQPNIDLSINV